MPVTIILMLVTAIDYTIHFSCHHEYQDGHMCSKAVDGSWVIGNMLALVSERALSNWNNFSNWMICMDCHGGCNLTPFCLWQS